VAITLVVERARDPHALSAWLAGVLLLSSAHQPVTLALAYGDRERFARHGRLFVLAPPVVIAAAALAVHTSLFAVAVVAGAWNAEHTLMQRYGLVRVYGRRAGDERGGLERAMLGSWLVLAIVSAAANPRTSAYLRRVDLGEINRRGVGLLTRLAPEASLMLAPAVVAAVFLTLRWTRAERTGDPNVAKWLYVGSTACLLGVMCVEPVAGFAAYVGAHAVEYFAVAGRTARREHRPWGAFGVIAATPGLVLGALLVLDRLGSFGLATVGYLTVGALHFVYDSVIWKLRRPAVAQVFWASRPPSTASTAPLM